MISDFNNATKPMSSSFTEILAALLDRRELDEPMVRAAMAQLLDANSGESEAAALLIAWRMKGETAEELAAAARVLREHMVPLETGRDDAVDTCGTGGDDAGSFNISTATAFVVAGAGASVVKHGNRAVSSSSGSADVLAELGIKIQEGVAWPRRCLDRAGLAFCFAPYFHPVLRHVAPIRKRLGVRTIFNSLGPLANPAGAAFQLLGIGRRELLDPMAGAVAKLGVRRAVLVHGSDGLDEVSLSGTTEVREIRDGEVIAREWGALDFGLEPCSATELRVSGPAHSAAVIRKILAGVQGAPARVVTANAAAALWIAGRVDSLGAGVQLACQAIHDGKAQAVLDALAKIS